MIPTTQQKPRIMLGVITGVHGIRGEIIVCSYTAEPADIAAYGPLQASDGRVLPKLSVVRVSERGVVARLAGVSDRNKAEAFKGTELWIERTRLPAAAEGEYYHADLIGLDAVAPDGSAIGEVVAIENFGAGDLIEVRLAGSSRTELFPFTRACVPEVDIAQRRVMIVAPETVEGEPGPEETAENEG